MKVVFNLLILITIVTLTSCNKKMAVTTKEADMHHGGRQVKPYFRLKTSVIKLTAGALIAPALGYRTDVNRNEGLKSAGEPIELPYLLTITGAVLSAAIVGGVIEKHSRSKNRLRDVNSSNFDKWLRKYNKATNRNYILAYNDQTYTYLVPNGYKNEFLKKEKVRLANLERDRNERFSNGFKDIISVLDGLIQLGNGTNKASSKDGYTRCSECNGSGKIYWRDRPGKAGASMTSKPYFDCERCLGEGRIRN